MLQFFFIHIDPSSSIMVLKKVGHGKQALHFFHLLSIQPPDAMPYSSFWFHLCSCLDCSCGHWSAGGGHRLLWHTYQPNRQCFDVDRIHNLPLLPCHELCDIFLEELPEATEWDLYSLLPLFFLIDSETSA